MCGLGNRKDDLVNQVIADVGVEPYEGTVQFIHQLRRNGFKIAVVTSSQNCSAVLMAAKLLGSEPERTVVIEDAISGVQAGAKGNFGLVIGIARKGNAEELKHHGAHLVVDDLAELLD